MAESVKRTLKSSDAIWLLIYFTMIGAVVTGMFRSREYALSVFGSAEAKAEWQDWRDAVKERKIEHDPVLRKVPKSAEPPTLVLLRDHFTVCLIAAVVLSSMVFASILFFIRGAMNSPAFVPRPDR